MPNDENKVNRKKDHRNFLRISDSRSFIKYSVHIARYCKSKDAAILLAFLINKSNYHEDHDELVSHEIHGHYWFYATIDKIEELTALTRKEQDSAIKILLELKLIEIVKFGLPCTRYFRINAKEYASIYLDEKVNFKIDDSNSNNLSSLYQSDKLDCTNRTNKASSETVQTVPYIYNNKSIRTNKKESIKEKARKARPIPINSLKTSFKENVFLTQEQHESLLSKIGKQKTESYYESLSDYKFSTGRKYASDYHTILNWIRRDEKENLRSNSVKTSFKAFENSVEDLTFSNREIAKSIIKDNWQTFREKQIYCDDKVNFIRIGNDSLYYDNPKFKELMKHFLVKNDLNLPERSLL